jgi:gluconokinase
MTVMPHLIILTGVAGSGKTTIGKALARRLDYPFYDADDFHPPQNVTKMARGEALNEDDRQPWLARLHTLLASLHARDESGVLACSALKAAYRRQLAQNLPGVCFVYLHGDPDLIFERLKARPGHYMSETMLQSQFDALQPPAPDEALHVDIDASVPTIVTAIVAELPHACPPGTP